MEADRAAGAQMQLPMSPRAYNRLVRELKYVNANILGRPAHGYQANPAGTKVKFAGGLLPAAPASLEAWWRKYFQEGASRAGAAGPTPGPSRPKPAARLAKSRRQVSAARDRSGSGLVDIEAFDDVLAEFAVPRTTLTPVAPATRRRRHARARPGGAGAGRRGAGVDGVAPNEGMTDSARGDASSGGADATLEQASPVQSVLESNGEEVAASTFGDAPIGGRGAAPDQDLAEFAEGLNHDLSAESAPGGAPPGCAGATPKQELGEFVEEPREDSAESAEEPDQGSAAWAPGGASAGGKGVSPEHAAAEIIDELTRGTTELSLEGLSAGGDEDGEPERFLAKFVEDRRRALEIIDPPAPLPPPCPAPLSRPPRNRTTYSCAAGWASSACRRSSSRLGFWRSATGRLRGA